MPRSPSNPNRIDLKFRAFSDQTRLRILHLLREGEWCVNDLLKVIDVPQPTASRHLAYLRRAGLVVTRRKGQWTFYALAPAENAFHKRLLECLADCFADIPALRMDAKRAVQVRKSGGCCPP